MIVLSNALAVAIQLAAVNGGSAEQPVIQLRVVLGPWLSSQNHPQTVDYLPLRGIIEC